LQSRRSRWRAVEAAGLLVFIVLLLGACKSKGGFPPLWDAESGLPGDLTEEREIFALSKRNRGPDGALLSAVRPFTVKVEDGKGASKRHVLPPIGSHLESARGEKTTAWPIVFDSEFGDETEREQDTSDDDTWIFPFFAWGEHGSHGSYFAFFPFYGTLKGKLLADRIDFVMFPLYAHTDAGDWHSTHVLWPLIAWGESPTRSHFRVLPFWSQSDSPMRSNRTLIWPIGDWGWEKHGDRTFDRWFVFPLAGHKWSEDGTFSEWTFLYPFFNFASDEKTGDCHTSIVWPVYKHSLRPGISESRWYWPFYGWYESETEHSSFYAWPIVWKTDEQRGQYRYKHFYVVPVWMSRETSPVDGAPIDEELRSWPFFSWRRRPGGVETLRVPEIIPFFGWEAGETCYADLVALFKWSGDDDGRVAWDLPLSVVKYRRDVKGRKTLTLLWWIDISLGDGE
jgi:hypothetical protein